MYGGDVCCFYFDDTISIHLNNLELLTLILQVNSGYYLLSTEDKYVYLLKIAWCFFLDCYLLKTALCVYGYCLLKIALCNDDCYLLKITLCINGCYLY